MLEQNIKKKSFLGSLSFNLENEIWLLLKDNLFNCYLYIKASQQPPGAFPIFSKRESVLELESADRQTGQQRHTGTERERQRQVETHRDTDRGQQTDPEADRQTQTEMQRQTEIHSRDRQRQLYIEADRQTEETARRVFRLLVLTPAPQVLAHPTLGSLGYPYILYML